MKLSIRKAYFQDCEMIHRMQKKEKINEKMTTVYYEKKMNDLNKK